MHSASDRRAARGILWIVTIAAIASPALAQLRVASWNVTNYGTGSTARDPDFQTAIFGVYQSRTLSPDVLVAQEITSATGALNFRNMLNAAAGSPGDWAYAPFIDGPDTDSAFFYRTSKVQYIATTVIAVGSSNTCNQPRNTYRYDFRPVGYTAASATIGLYSVHMKAQGSDDPCTDPPPNNENSAGRRLVEATNIRMNAQGVNTNGGGSALPAGYHFMMAGDTNIQTASSPEYVQLVGSQANNAGRLFDPIKSPGNWNNGSSYKFIHTQDPISGGGGMDDRHDQILLSAGLIDGVGFDYVGNPAVAYSTTTWNDPNHSYRAWGNDGTSYNLPLTIAGNTMVGDTIAQALRNHTGGGGGHLPIVLDLRVPAKVTSATTINFGTVLQNAVAQQTLTVSNNGDTALYGAGGIATLYYTLSASAGFSAPGGSFTEAAGGGGNNHTLSMNTATPGVKNGTVTITSDDPDQPARIVTLIGTVAQPFTLGDMNCDGALNNFDIDPFILALLYPAGYQLYYPSCDIELGDIDGDGSLTNFDIDPFVQCLFGGGCP